MSVRAVSWWIWGVGLAALVVASFVVSEAIGGPSSTGGVLVGVCEASTIVPWNGGFLVGDNETSDRLFAFSADLAPIGGAPLVDPIEDIESIARDGDRIWVVGSESASKKGQRRSQRERIAVLGGPWSAVDLSVCRPCEAARGEAPSDGGLNIEGSIVIDGRLWIGLRGPLIDGKAVLLRLSIDATRADDVRTVDLGGLGIRELSPWRGGILVIAGPVADEPVPHELYWLSAPDTIPRRLPIALPPSTEGLTVDDAGDAVFVTDGAGKAGTTCDTPSIWGRVRIPEPPTP